MELCGPQDRPRHAGALHQLLGRELGAVVGEWNPVDADNRDIGEVGDPGLAGQIEQTARALDIDLLGVLAWAACRVDNCVDARERRRQPRAALKLSLRPLYRA